MGGKKVHLKSAADVLYYSRVCKLLQNKLEKLDKWEQDFVYDLCNKPPVSFTKKTRSKVREICEKVDLL